MFPELLQRLPDIELAGPIGRLALELGQRAGFAPDLLHAYCLPLSGTTRW